MTTTSSSSAWPYRLLAPGPVPVPPQVLRAMGEKVLHHRTPQFIAILKSVWRELRSVFATQQPVQILTGTGSAAMEAALLNTLSPGDEVVCVVSGKFGERWADMVTKFGCVAHRLDVPWGEKLDLPAFEAALRAHPKATLVLTQVCETSTATLHPIREMSALVRRVTPNALFAVDAITAVGCLPLPMDEWELDIVVGGSQKAFMIPAGLSFIALSPRAWEAQKRSKLIKYYFDLAAERAANDKGDSQFSIPTPLIVGLHVVLERLGEVGLPKLFERCRVLSEATLACGEGMGLAAYSRSPSPSVTALKTHDDSAKLRDWLESERNITVMGGQDSLKGKILRVGHMGDVRDGDMVALFTALAERLGQTPKFESTLRPALEKNLLRAEPLFT